MTGPSVPSWGGVAASLLLVALAAAVAARHRLGLTRELIVAAARAGIQLIAVGAVLLVVFVHAGLAGAFGWVTLMILIAGQVAGRHGTGLPHARMTATTGVTMGSALPLGALIISGVISTQPRVVIPVGGMIVFGALQATGLALRRLREDAETAREAIEARLSLGFSAREAFLPHQRSTLRTALLPAIDSTKVVGLDQPARRHDRTDPGRGRSAHSDPLPDRRDVHAARRHCARGADHRPAGRTHPVRPRPPPHPARSTRATRKTMTGRGAAPAEHRDI